MENTNNTIDPELAKGIAEAVSEVSNPEGKVESQPDKTEEVANESPVENNGEGETAKSEDIEDFVADDGIVERAVRAGLTLEDAKAFKSKEQAERILDRIEEKSKVSEVKEADGNKSDEGEGFPARAEFEKVLKEIEEDGDYSPQFVSLFKGMGAMLEAQSKEIASLKKAGASAETMSFFDKQISGLGDGVAKHLDAASRSKLESKFKMLERAYGEDSSMKREDIFKEAATLAIGDILARAEAEGKTARIAERRNLTLARPGGESGIVSKSEPMTEEGIAEALFKRLTT